MSVFFTMLVVIMFGLIPFLKLNEKKHIEKTTRDRILLEIKKDKTAKASLIFILIGVVLIFALPIGQHGIYLAIMKILTIIGLYFVEEEMRTKYYLGENSLYEVTRFKNNTFVTLKRVTGNQIFRITNSLEKDLVYRIHFQTNGIEEEKTVDIKIEDNEDLEILKQGLERIMNLHIEKPKEETLNIIERKEKESKFNKKINSILAKALLLTVIFVLIKEIFFVEETTLKLIVTKTLAYSYIPMTIYLAVSMFVRIQFKHLKKSKKDFLTIASITSMLLPFATIAINGTIEAQRYTTVVSVGAAITCVFLIIATVISIIMKKIRNSNIRTNMENVLNKAHGKKSKA